MIVQQHLVFGRSYVKPFIAIFDTRNTSSGSSGVNQLNIPVLQGKNNNFSIDWGDGTIQTVVTATSTFISHIYSVAGVYTVKIIGNFYIGLYSYSNDRLKIKEILQWGDCILNGGRFAGCNNLILTNVNDTPKIAINTSFQSLFEGCGSLLTVNNLSNWDFTNVTRIDLMFTQCANFNQDIYFKNTNNISNAASMFWLSPSFNGNISFSMSSITTLNAFLSGATNFNKDISSLVSSFNVNVILTNFMASKTANNYNYNYYDNFLIALDMKDFTSRTQSKILQMGTVKYSANGATARANLISKGWSISDGGAI